MIITKTPLRISFFGGGSDLLQFSCRHGGSVISITIDKFIYVAIRRRQDNLITLDSYFEHEKVEAVHQLKHAYVRRAVYLDNLLVKASYSFRLVSSIGVYFAISS